MPGAEDTQAVPLDVNTFPDVPTAVNPVPPLATASVPPSVTLPVVAVFGVNPVVPPLNELTVLATEKVVNAIVSTISPELHPTAKTTLVPFVAV